LSILVKLSRNTFLEKTEKVIFLNGNFAVNMKTT